MTLELDCLLIQIFAEGGAAGAPFTLKEITLKLSEAYNRRFTYSAIHRAWAALADNPNTAEIVRPLPGDSRALEFDAVAARRIARRVVHGHLPARYEDMLRERKLIATKAQSAIAARRRLRQS